MNRNSTSATGDPRSAVPHDALQARFALRVTARLSEHAQGLDADLGERLRAARERSLEAARRARQAQAATAPARLGRSGGAAVLGGGSPGWWIKLASVLPVIALVGGLFLIQQHQTTEQISGAAEIDAALLTDDLPPAAYSDAGFVEYLNSPGE